MSSIEQFIAALPKAELHVHLEGCVEPDMLWELAVKYQTPLAAQGRESVQQLYATRDFSGFLQAFKTVCQHLRAPEDYERVTYAALARLARQNVRYAEITVAAGVILWKSEDLPASFSGIEAGYERARRDFGLRVQWIFDAVRQFGPEAAMAVARQAAALQDRGVMGFGIGGDEQQAPPAQFRDVYAYARRQGLRLTAHAGETGGADSISDAVHVLGVERIGHGLRAIEDPALVRSLAKMQIPLDVCITSNMRTGSLEAAPAHPLPLYISQGVLVSLNTDDPALFGTDLNREYLLAHEVFGLDRSQLISLAESSFRAAFLTHQEKEAYLSAFAPPFGLESPLSEYFQ